MADLYEYLSWRGDLSFSQVSPGPVDALIFSILSYIDFAGIVPQDMAHPVPLHVAANALAAVPDAQNRLRVKADLPLLQATAAAPRFRNTLLCFYRSKLLPEEQTQFAAITFLPEDSSAFLAFRGTDDSLIGWKEDFNMSFQDSIPAQREAAAYTEKVAAAYPGPLRLGGHSKGGNLAVFACAKASVTVQKRITEIYNLDGPGFTDYLMGDPGYLQMVPKIQTYIPESSIIGILLEHEEPYTVIKSRQLGVLQHEPHSWEVMAGDFIQVEKISSGSRFIDRAIKNWIRDMTPQERGAFVDAVFALLSAGGASNVAQLLHPKSIQAFFRALDTNEQARKLLGGELVEFLKAASNALPFRKEAQ